ncbi:MAG: DUF4280 domain-containing protein [Cetobacterium sp.]
MSVTDKELLTFCNLTNLKMEYANLIKGYEDGPKDSNGKTTKIPINHTIYSLLHGDDFKNKEDENHEEYIKKLINEVFIDTTIDEKGTFILEMSEDEAKKSGKKIYKDNLKLLEDATIVFDQLDNENNNFLKEWEIIYADDNFGITLDFFLSVYNQIYSSNINSRRKLLKEIVAFNIKKNEKLTGNLRNKENIEILGKNTPEFLEILAMEKDALEKDILLIFGVIIDIYGNDFPQLLGTATNLPNKWNPDTVITNLSREEILKIVNEISKNPAGKAKTKNILNADVIKLKKIISKELSSLTLKYSKVNEIIGKINPILRAVFWLNLIKELNESLKLINKIQKKEGNILHSLSLRKSDLRMIILKREEKIIINFNDFKEDEKLKKIIERGIITEEINQILTVILNNILKDVKVEVKNEEYLTSKNVQTLLIELSDIIKEKNITFTGFGAGGELAFFISNILEKPNKIFIDDYNNFKTTENIINFDLDDLEMFDNKMSEISFNTRIVDVTLERFYKITFENTRFFLLGVTWATLSPIVMNVAQVFSILSYQVLSKLILFLKNGVLLLGFPGLLVCLFEFALWATLIYVAVYAAEQYRLNSIFEFLIEFKYLKKIKKQSINLVTDEIINGEYNGYKILPIYRFLILALKNNKMSCEENKESITFKEEYSVHGFLETFEIKFILNLNVVEFIKVTATQYGEHKRVEKVNKHIEILDILEQLELIPQFKLVKNLQEFFMIFKLLEFYYSFQNKALNQENLKLINSDFYYLDVNQENKFIVTKESEFEKILQNKEGYNCYEVIHSTSYPVYQEKRNPRHIKNKKIPFDNEYRFYPFLIGDNLTENINSNYIVTAMAKAVENYNENKSLKTEVDEQIDYTELKFPEKFKLTKEEVKQENIKKYVDKSIPKFPYKEEIQEELNLFSDKYFIMETERDENKKLGALKFNEKDKNEPNFCYHPITNFNNNILKLNIPLVEKVEDGNPSQKIVLDGAILRCDKGAATSKLIVTSQNILKENGKKVATIEDFKENKNIKSFVICRAFTPPKTCSIKIKGPWSEGTTQVSICGKNGLIENCTCECEFGGKIKIEKAIGKTKAK